MVDLFRADTPNFRTEAAKKIAELFPETVIDGKIDLESLEELLNTDLNLDGGNEKYEFTWRGKRDSKRLADSPANKTTLILNDDKSVKARQSKNIYIESDNLEALKLLQKSYSDKIKMIYIDPPYNTGSDFIYKDNFTSSYENYLRLMGFLDDEGNTTTSNKEMSGRFHTDWLNLMYPRLKLARNLLRPDGVIFISIDDKEYDNLKKICNEIFGEQNFVGNIVWKSRVKPVNIGEAKYRPQKEIEYVLAYQKSDTQNKFLPLYTGGERSYPHELDGRKYRLATILKSNRGTNRRSTMTFSLDGYTPPEGQRWQAGEDEINYLNDNGYLEFKDGTPFKRYFEDEEGAEHDPFYCFMESDWSSSSEAGKSELNNLIGENHGFDTVKPVRLIQTLIQSVTRPDKEDIILDFFSGSATTAHAVIKQNSIDNGDRRYILVQTPEKTDRVKSEYETITELAQKRIKKVISDYSENTKLDLGFKVYELSQSTIHQWDSSPEKFEEQLELLSEEVFTQNSTNFERAREIALKSGITLDIEPVVSMDNYHFVSEDKEVFVILGKYDDELLSELNSQRKNSVALIVLREFEDGSEIKFNIIESLKQNENYKNHFHIEWL